MTINFCRFFLLVLRGWEERRHDDGDRAEGNQRKLLCRPEQLLQQLQEFRVSETSATFKPFSCRGGTRLSRLVILSCVSEILRPCKIDACCCSSFKEVAGCWPFWLKKLLSFWSLLVSDSSTHSPPIALSTGHVAMEDSKLMQFSGPSQALDPRDPDSRNVSQVLEKEVGNERNIENTSRHSSPHGEPSSTVVHQPSSGARSPSKFEDGVAGPDVVGPTAAEEQGTLGNLKNEAFKLAGADKHDISSDPVLHCDGESAANNSAEPDGRKDEVLRNVEASTEASQRSEVRMSQTTDAPQNGKPEGNSTAFDDKFEERILTTELANTAKPILTEVLDKLISLDPTEVFKDPVDDSLAPNYSKVIKLPMCFSMMQEKIELNLYKSWRLFLEDFERICNNAMKYNQKRSKIWNAASTLLLQGRKVLEPYIQSGDVVFGVGESREVPDTLIENAVTILQDTSQAHVRDSGKDTFLLTAGESQAATKIEQDAANSITLDDANNQLVATKNLDRTSRKWSTDDNERVFHEKEVCSRPYAHDGKIKRKGAPGEPELSEPEDNEVEALPLDGSKRIVKKQTVSITPDISMTTVRHKRGSASDLKLFSNTQGRVAGYSERLRIKNNMNEDVKVEILEMSSPEDLRPDLKDEATECSSSFGYTRSTVDSDLQAEGLSRSAEVESALRDGNGALSCPFAEDDELIGGNERGKKALNVDWKKYRRGIEWRCRWLEIRLNDLKARSDKYERLLKEKKRKKSWVMDLHADEGYSARSAQIFDHGQNTEVLRRVPRKEVESTVDLDLYMGRHPLFSRYDKKRKGEIDDALVEPNVEELQHVQNLQNSGGPERNNLEESDTEEHLVTERPSVGGQDSMEQILWKVEALQARVGKAKFSLSKGAPAKMIGPVASSKPPTSLPRLPLQPSPRIPPLGSSARPPGTKGRPPSGQSPGFSGTPTANGAPQRQVSASIRRKSSDYDINNMVMPVSVGAKYVEHIKHADIWTPHWRLVQNTAAADQSMDDSSSDEDTDDERVAMRHAEMEMNERMQRYTLPPKRSPTGDPAGSGKGKSKSGIGKGAGKMSGRGSVPTSKVELALAADSQDSSSSSAFARSIPKGKRRKRLFNATAFTTTHAQRLAAYLAESSSAFHAPKARDSIILEHVVELKTSEDTSVDSIPPETDESITQQELQTDDGEPKLKRPVAVGLQVLANP